jgi:ribose transport system ATP-binding protein
VNKTVLELKNITKSFGGIQALKGVNLEVSDSEVHGLIGENGSGKSTLIKILTGVHQRDDGQIFLFGEETQIPSPIVARQKGIVAIYQELSLVDQSSVAENLFLGHEPIKAQWLGLVDRKLLMENAKHHLASFGLDVSPNTKVGDLGIGEKRIVEILKVLSINAKIILLDEPTTGMSRAEIDLFFKLLQRIKNEGVTMIYISHHLDEIFNVCDRVSVLRDGENAGTFNVNDVDRQLLIRTMIGKGVAERVIKPKKQSSSPPVLEAHGYQAEGMRSPITFSLHKGEVLGVTGIVGAGKSELGRALFGAAPKIHGNLKVMNQDVDFKSPRDAQRMGIAFIPEDRKTQGLFLNSQLYENIAITNLEKAQAGAFISSGRLQEMASGIISKLGITPPLLDMIVRNLSGGNQQKVVLGKWLVGHPQILIMDEPTRGIDVGAKSEIYRLIETLAERGMSILLLSSEFTEINALCDRVLVLRYGSLVSEMDKGEYTTEHILSASLGGLNYDQKTG